MAARAKLLDAQAVAGILGVPKMHVYEMARKGTLPCVRFPDSRLVRFDPDVLDSWILKHSSPRARRAS